MGTFLSSIGSLIIGSLNTVSSSPIGIYCTGMVFIGALIAFVLDIAGGR